MGTITPFEVRIGRRRQEAVDIISLELVSLDGQPLPAFSAGSHIDLHVGGFVRQYSLCNDPQESHRYQIAVLRDPQSRGGSVAVHDTLREGDIVRISAPSNLFPLVPARRTLLFAGGIGITPILCMAERLQQAGAEFELHYCGRSQERLAFRERISTSAFADRTSLHLDDGPEGQKLDAERVLQAPEIGVHLYVCGPSGFIDHIVQTALRLGWADINIHVERFSAVPVDTSGDQAFDVKIASTGAIVRVPADCPVTDALERAGIELPVSCGQGICGTCVVRVLAGEPDHRDAFFTDDEHAANDQFTPCCSRSKSPLLVLDL
jgi:vanillate O-demethylase ferredoxin subunit